MESKEKEIYNKMHKLFGSETDFKVEKTFRHYTKKGVGKESHCVEYMINATIFHKTCECCGNPKEHFIYHRGKDIDKVFKAVKAEYEETTSK